jgi:hypothetical protein
MEEGQYTTCMRVRKRIINGSLLDMFKSTAQIMHPYSLAEWEAEGIALYGKELPRLERVEVPESHPAWPYLSNRSHDAGVFSFEVEEDAAVLILNDNDGRKFALARIPVALSFEGLEEFAVFQAEVNGKLTRLKHSLRKNLSKVSEFVADWVLQLDDGGVVIILQLRVKPARCTLISQSGAVSPPWRVWVQHDLYICVRARAAVAVEMQRQEWIKLYGEDTAYLWDLFTKARKDKAFTGYDNLDFLVTEFLRAQGR